MVEVKESILQSTKKLLGISDEDTNFDIEIILHINSVFMILTQLGVGPKEGFEIEDEKDTWSSFLSENKTLNGIKSYIYQKVRLMFDPPQMGYLVDAIKKQCDEFEWRLAIQAENIIFEEEKQDAIDYNDLTNRPKIENTILEGNKKLSDIGITTASNEQIASLFK